MFYDIKECHDMYVAVVCFLSTTCLILIFLTNSPSFHVSPCPSSLLILQTTSNLSAVDSAFEVTEQDQLAVCYPDQQWVDYDGTSYIFNRQRYHTQCVDMQQQPFEYGALSGYYTTGEPCASACVQGDNRSQLKGCYPEDR